MPYEVKMDITREACLGLLTSLAENDDIRAEFVSNTREILTKNGIEVGDETLPETVTLPMRNRSDFSSICWRWRSLLPRTLPSATRS